MLSPHTCKNTLSSYIFESFAFNFDFDYVSNEIHESFLRHFIKNKDEIESRKETNQAERGIDITNITERTLLVKSSTVR